MVSNLGTTFTSWLLAMVGFRYNIDQAVPACCCLFQGIDCIHQPRKIISLVKVFFSLSFLFFPFIDSGMEGWVGHTDLVFQPLPFHRFCSARAALTWCEQSSSATMALTLAALFRRYQFSYMASITAWFEIGTTMKLFVASANGRAPKAGGFGKFSLINLVTTLVVWIILTPVYRLHKPMACGSQRALLRWYSSRHSSTSSAYPCSFLS